MKYAATFDAQEFAIIRDALDVLSPDTTEGWNALHALRARIETIERHQAPAPLPPLNCVYRLEKISGGFLTRAEFYGIGITSDPTPLEYQTLGAAQAMCSAINSGPRGYCVTVKECAP